MLSILGPEAGSRAPHIVKVLVPKADEIFLSDLIIEVADGGPIRRNQVRVVLSL
jgi:hypothetical protein